MSDKQFEATFHIGLDRDTVWQRLTGKRSGADELWLPGFDSAAVVSKSEPTESLHVVKKDPPCEGLIWQPVFTPAVSCVPGATSAPIR